MKKRLILPLLWAIFPALLPAQDLAAYLRMADTQNPGLKALYAEFEAALQQIPQVGLPDPSLTLSAFGSMVETRTGPQQARVSLSQSFPWFGALAARRDEAALRAEASYQAYLDARNGLLFQVKAAYFPIWELEETIRLQEANLELLQSLKRLAITQFQHGKAEMADVIRADILIGDAQTAIEIRALERRPLLAAFNELLNRDPQAAVEVQDTLVLGEWEPVGREDSLPADHPRLRAIEQQIQAAAAAEKSAVKAGMPMLSLGLDYIAVGRRTDDNPMGNGRDVLMPMVMVSLPIYRKKYVAARKEAQFMQQVYEHRMQETENKLRAEIEMAHFEREGAATRATLYQGQIAQSRQAIYLLSTSFANEGKNFGEILRMQQEVLRYQIETVSALRNYHIARAKMDYLIAKSE